MSWWVIETLAGRAGSVVWGSGAERNWASLDRISRSTGVDGRKIVAHILRTQKPIGDLPITARRTPLRVRTALTVGPDHRVSAVCIWIAKASVEPPPPPRLGVFVWDRSDHVAHQTASLHRFRADCFTTFRERVELPSLLRNVLQFERAAQFVELCFRDGQPFLDTLDLRHDAKPEQLMKWQLVARASADDGKVHGIIHDITDDSPVTIGTQGIRGSSKLSGQCLVRAAACR